MVGFAANIMYIYRKYAVIMYIFRRADWPNFTWSAEAILSRLGEVHQRQGRILGQMQAVGFKIREDTMLDTLTLDVTKSSEIEGERLNAEQVRSSIARRLGLDIGGAVPADRHVEGVVEMMLDATQQYEEYLTEERLFDWHAALFPTGRSGMHKITVGGWRTPETGPMQVVSGPMGRETVHFEAPQAGVVAAEMRRFLEWFNGSGDTDPIVKAGVAHLWFVTIHPFDDGNGRITRALTDMQLARADHSAQRFYSMSAQILKERKTYYELLESTQKAGLDITPWLQWFLDCLYSAMNNTEKILAAIFDRRRFYELHRDTELNIRQQKMIAILLDGFYGKLSTSKWAKMAKCSQDTALRDIQDLVNKGILGRQPGGGRSTNYALIRTQ